MKTRGLLGCRASSEGCGRCCPCRQKVSSSFSLPRRIQTDLIFYHNYPPFSIENAKISRMKKSLTNHLNFCGCYTISRTPGERRPSIKDFIRRAALPSYGSKVPEKVTVLGGGVPDPYGGDLETYIICANAIKAALAEQFDSLVGEGER